MRAYLNHRKQDCIIAEATAQHGILCELDSVKTDRTYAWILAMALALGGACLPINAQTFPAGTNENGIDAANSAPADPTETTVVESTKSRSAAEENVSTATGSDTPAVTPSSVAATSGFAAFQIITDRNIFNGNRSGQRISSTRSSSQQSSVQVDAFSLVGTLVSEKGPVAFFDGTEEDFREAVKPGDNIAGFEVREVRYAGVRLAEGTNTFDLAVGSGMRRENRGLWKHTTEITSFASTGSSGSSPSDSFSRNSGNGSRSNGGDSTPEVNDVLKRLMEQREKE